MGEITSPALLHPLTDSEGGSERQSNLSRTSQEVCGRAGH